MRPSVCISSETRPFFAERRDAHIFQRSEVWRLGDGGKQLALDFLERSK